MSKTIYERVLDFKNRISLDGDDTIYEEDHLLLNEVLDHIISNQQRAQEETYNYTVGIQKELEAGATIRKQEKLLELYKELANYRARVIHKLLDEVACLTDRKTTKEEDITYILAEAKNYGHEDKRIIEEIKNIKEL